jgi:cysteine desulfurase
MDLAGIAVSSGSACSSGKVAASHVLKAMGVADDLAACALRLSIGPATTRADIDGFLQAWSRHLAALSKEQRGLAA